MAALALHDPKVRKAALGGAMALSLAAFAWTLWPQTSAPPASEPVAIAPPILPPAPVAPPPEPAAPAPLAAGLSTLVLRGVLASGAVFGDGASQRLVRIGRDVMPGATLKAIGVSHVILATASGDMRLAFNRAATAQAPAAPTATGQPAAANARREVAALRMGLEPRKADGGIRGYRVKPGARLPLLASAGLQPGDVLIAVGTDAIDSEERLFDMPQQIGADPVAISFERGGRTMTAKVSRGG
ncbi:hypothetical protein [Allosphingosinicella indica]|uniref:General secretion pathway protein C n=1 Tax=Allosphingosinicella indica TaxID=941907 RepID=A0A1X7H188_9SPHN|nr:hypothetical protein [Allosphingosinicella indica]SMF78049.1 general secretion pathway protein C [Allosphingosinicella indica]